MFKIAKEIMKKTNYDLIVVGAGHAGVEASLVAERLGLNVLLATTNSKRISFMSCNPAIGGLAKGHIVREIEALGGQMGLGADKACIQFKRLNQKKGPAVQWQENAMRQILIYTNHERVCGYKSQI